MFDTKPYDRESFEKHINSVKHIIKYFDTRLTKDTAGLAAGSDVVVAFVNDSIDAETVDLLYGYGVKLIALRCADRKSVV